MGETKLFFTKDKELARRTARYWLVGNPDHVGVVVAETDKISLADAENPFGAGGWTTPEGGPWYLILATPDSFASGSGNAASLANAPEPRDEEE